jgi:hypothetical protein
MKTSMRKTIATLLLSGTAAIAGPVFAQQADQNNQTLLPQGQEQSEGSAETQGGADMNAGSAKGSAGANATAETPDSGMADQDSAQSGSGSATGETEKQTTEKPAADNAEQNAAQSNDDASTSKTNRETTAESSQPTEDGATTDKAQSNTEDETDSEAAGASTSNETTASIDITTEQRTEIHNVIVENDAKPVDVDFDVNVGVVVPRTVELRPLPPRIVEIVPAYRTYKYILLADGRILIVEPASLKIVYVITA